MKFKASLLYGNFFVALIFVTFALVHQYNPLLKSVSINLSPINNFSKTIVAVSGIKYQLPEIVLGENVLEKELNKPIESTRKIKKTIHETKKISDKTTQKKFYVNENIKEPIEIANLQYKEVISKVSAPSGLDLLEEKETIASNEAKAVETDSVNVEDSVNNFEKSEEINNQESLKLNGFTFSALDTLDVKEINNKLANMFLQLKKVEVAIKEKKKDELKQKNEMNNPGNVDLKLFAANDQNKNEIKKESKKITAKSALNFSEDKVTTQFSKNRTNETSYEFEVVEDVKEVEKTQTTNINQANKTIKQAPNGSGDKLEKNTQEEMDYSDIKEDKKQVTIEQVDEFYVLDYSKNVKSDVAPRQVDSHNQQDSVGVSQRVAVAIEREKEEGKKQAGKDTILSYNSSSGPKSEVAPISRKEDYFPKEEDSNAGKGAEFSMVDNFKNQEDYKSGANVTLKIVNAKFNKGLTGNLNSFEFVSSHNHQDSFYDNNEGIIDINRELNSDFSTMSGTIVKSDFLRTRFDMVLEKDDLEINIPVFSVRDFTKFLDKNNANLPGSFILAELDESIEDIQLETENEKYFYLNDLFEIVERAEATYLLIAGVEPGNVLIKYLINNQVAQKIIFVEENELFFDNASFERGGLDTFDLFEEGLLVKKPRPLDISNSAIKYFNYQTMAQRESLYTYTIKTPYRTQGSRKYLELSHLSEPIYVGYDNAKKLIIPNQELMDYIINSFGFSNLENSCMLQINLVKNPSEVIYTGHSAAGEIGLEVKYLDGEGNMTREVAETSEKIFINGDRVGVVNIEIKYLDGTVDYLQTYCSNKSYLIEQL